MKKAITIAFCLFALSVSAASVKRNSFTTNSDAAAKYNLTIATNIVITYGALSGNASGATNIPLAAITNAGTAGYSNTAAFMLTGAATTNDPGDITIQGNNAWLQMIGTGNPSGQRIYRFLSGTGIFALQRASDANDFQVNVFSMTNDLWTFGIPLMGLSLKDVTVFPTNSIPVGSATETNVYMFTYNGVVRWVATNYAGGGWMEQTNSVWGAFSP